jgi:hypothetical protein
MVKRKPSRLTLNLKGEGYAIHDALTVDVAEGKVRNYCLVYATTLISEYLSLVNGYFAK